MIASPYFSSYFCDTGVIIHPPPPFFLNALNIRCQYQKKKKRTILVQSKASKHLSLPWNILNFLKHVLDFPVYMYLIISLIPYTFCTLNFPNGLQENLLISDFKMFCILKNLIFAIRNAKLQGLILLGTQMEFVT